MSAYDAASRRRLLEQLWFYEEYLALRFRDDWVWLHEIMGWPDEGDR